MGRWLAVTGIVLTACYAGFAWWLVGDRIHTLKTMQLNEVGDFLAGAFGPLAILWLVLGFFQQGIELRQGSKALNLRAEELRNSVEAQRELVSVTREQVNAEFERMSEAKVERTKKYSLYLSARVREARTQGRITPSGSTSKTWALQYHAWFSTVRGTSLKFPAQLTL